MSQPDSSGARVLEPVASTKLLPPRAARHLIQREALQARLLEARRQRCVVVQGPAGSGKTSTLVAWRQALMSMDFDVAWLSLAPEDDDLTRFFQCLLASLAEVDEGMVRETSSLMGREHDESATEYWVISLVQGIANHQRELVLVLDDLHCLEDARIFQALQWLLEYAPPNLHLAFGSRNALPLSLARLRSQGQVAEFDLRDLRFSAEESERFLREQLGSIDKRDAQVLHELTDGWVAGLQLFALDLKGKKGTGYARVLVRDPQAFASYFEREVLVHLAPDDLQLLTRIAVCNRFCASLCAALAGQPQAVAAMTSWLTRLDTDNLFVGQVTGHDLETWYRVHPLLREVLLARLALLPEAEQRAPHGAAWRWFKAHGHIDEAVRHAVQAGEVEAAAALVESWAAELMTRGELTQLAGLVRRLPAEQVQRSFRLRLLTSHLMLYARDFDALEVELQRLESDFDAMDARQRYGVTLLRAGIALQRDDTDAAMAILPALQAIPEDAEAYAFVGRGHILAWLHAQRGDYELARASLSDLSSRPIGPGRRLLSRSFEGMSYALEGRLADAERTLRDVLQEADSNPAVDAGIACVAAGLLSDALYESNDLEGACKLLEPRIDLIERAAIPDAVLRALMVLAHSHWLAGRRLEALSCLERLEDYGTEQQLDRALSHALFLRLRVHLRHAETPQAEQVLARIEALAARHAVATPGTAAEIVRNGERARVMMSLYWNDFDAAVSRLVPLIEATESAGRWRLAAALWLLLAIAQEGRGNLPAARDALIDALRHGHRLGLMRSLLDISPDTPRMLQSLLDEQVLDPVLAFYAQRLLAAGRHSAESVSQPAEYTGGVSLDALSEREREVLNLVAQAMPNKKIARVLGVTTHTVKWHLRKIYTKLDTTKRDEAVARLRDLEAGEASRPR